MKVDLHAAAGGNLAPVSEPGDLWPGEAVYPRCVDERALTLGYSLRPFALDKTTHVWRRWRKARQKKNKVNINSRRETLPKGS